MSGKDEVPRDFRITDYQPDARDDAEEELRFYLEMREAELREEGHSPEDARRIARERFGDPERIAGQVEALSRPTARSKQRRLWLASVAQDVRYALRALRRSPGFAAVAVLTLGLGIGANTAIFSVVSAALVRQPPVLEPERLVAVHTTCRAGDPRCSSSYPDYQNYRDRQDAVRDLAAFDQTVIGMGLERGARLVAVEQISGNYFELLGLAPQRGRLIQPADDAADGDPAVAVVSDALWRGQLGSDPEVVGRTIRLNQGVFTVVGVAPRDFGGLLLGSPAEVWVPLRAEGLIGGDPTRLDSRGSRWISHLVGRLADGVTVERARAELLALSDRLAELDPAARGPRGITVDPPGGYIVPGQEPEQVGRFVLLLQGVVGLTLLLACANLANLLLARGTARRTEMGLRRALGAGRGRLLRQLVTEGLVLSMAGGAVGLLFAVLLLAGMSGLTLPFGFDIGSVEPRLDAGVLAFTFGLTVAAGVLFALVPALRSAGASPAATLREGRSGSTRDAARLQAGLVGLQVALSLVLLAGAGLFLRTLREGLTRDYGFEVEGLALFAFDASAAGHSSRTAAPIVRALEERARGVPGVVAASAGNDVPLLGGTMGVFVTVDGYEPAPDEELRVELNFAEPGWFRALGLELVRGRDIGAADVEGGPPVAVISQTMAERWWPGRDAIGGTFTLAGETRRVVGIARDTRYNGVAQEEFPHVTLPMAQVPSRYATTLVIVARTTGPVEPVLSSLDAELRALDAQIPVILSSTMGRELGGLLGPQRLAAWMLGGFSILALLLAAVGLYGVVGYAVARRMPELAVRAALGAEEGDLRRSLLLRHGWPLALGVVMGVAGALAATRVASAFLLGVGARDPATLVAVAVLLSAVGVLAMLVPTRRLRRLQPMQVLRVE